MSFLDQRSKLGGGRKKGIPSFLSTEKHEAASAESHERATLAAAAAAGKNTPRKIPPPIRRRSYPEDGLARRLRAQLKNTVESPHDIEGPGDIESPDDAENPTDIG